MTLQEEVTALADALRSLAAVVPNLQVSDYWNENPTTPSVDLVPGNPFQDGATLGGVGHNRIYMTVRARVGMDDPVAGMQLLYRFLDPQDPASIEAAAAEADWVVVPEGVTGFTQYADDLPGAVRMMGSDWRVSKLL